MVKVGQVSKRFTVKIAMIGSYRILTREAKV
jgi:hypothetical protein